ncbi:hypothetical protein ACJMK2_042943 [Sinanodonta woodiana]|uniref:Cyclin-like domain-containing protein n=1 Tax=Sinanodonta woodiana TaxID=1069815 RepID=A0ABD3VYN0_SINWO
MSKTFEQDNEERDARTSFNGLSEFDEGICLDNELLKVGTPDVTAITNTLGDSGFTETLNLQCLEYILDLPEKNPCYKPFHDSLDPLSCPFKSPDHSGFEEYMDDIYRHRLSIEVKYQALSCLDNQPEVTPGIRGVLIGWLSNLHHEMKLGQDTLYLAVNIIDRVLDIMQVARDCLQLLGVTALLIACKQEEIAPPLISEILHKCGENFPPEQVKQLEKIVLMSINFDLMPPNSQQFLEYFYTYFMASSVHHVDYKFGQAHALARCVIELSMQDYELCQFRPSLLALCIWKECVQLMGLDDGNFFPPGMNFFKEQYEYCLAEVKVFVTNLKRSWPDMLSMTDYYTSLYGLEN